MELGMLWFDNDPSATMETKISRAAKYYEAKHGQIPNMVYVHDNPLSTQTCNGITVKVNRTILPNHFWVGIDNGK